MYAQVDICDDSSRVLRRHRFEVQKGPWSNCYDGAYAPQDQDVKLNGYTIIFDVEKVEKPVRFMAGSKVRVKATGLYGRVLAVDLLGGWPIVAAVKYEAKAEERPHRYSPEELEVV